LSSSQTTYAPPSPSWHTIAALAMFETTIPVSRIDGAIRPSPIRCRKRSATYGESESFGLTPNHVITVPSRPSQPADSPFTCVPGSVSRQPAGVQGNSHDPSSRMCWA
jgi:hypothetical protein